MEKQDVYSKKWWKDQLSVKQEINAWIKGAMYRQGDKSWKGQHDEGNFTCAWGDFYRLTGDSTIKEFLKNLRDIFRDWLKKNQYHGFQPKARDHASHSFENFEDFVTKIWEMDPADQKTVSILEDVGHHVGNWAEEVPDWYDWDEDRFLSYFLGTKEVKDYPPYNFEKCSHCRIGSFLLTVYKATGRERYLDWCKRYADKWTEIIFNSRNKIPMYLYPEDLSEQKAKELYNFHKEDAGEPFQGDMWALITNRSLVKYLLDLYEITKEKKHLEAVDKALTLYKGVLSSDRITNTYLRYQEVTGSNKFQKQLKEWYEKKIKPVLNKNINIPNSLVVTDCDYPEFAYRDDADNFDFYDGPEVPDLVKGYKISKNLDILQLAMKIAQKRLSLGNYIIRDGWEHGCNTRRFLHGKGNDAAQTLYTGTGVGKIHYFKYDETPGLPEEVAVLCRENNESYNLYFYNQDQKGKKMKVVIRKEGFHNKSIIKKGKLEEKLVKKAQMVELKPGEITEIKINK